MIKRKVLKVAREKRYCIPRGKELRIMEDFSQKQYKAENNDSKSLKTTYLEF